MSKITKEFKYGNYTVKMETGRLARQATAAVLVDVEDTQVLVSVVGKKEPKPGQDFFPLTVNYVEKYYSSGRIPGGFLKREGRPTDGETLTARLIDRPIRPLFPDGFMNEVQVVVQVISFNPDVQPDIPAMIGVSAALSISGIPFNGPIGAARVGYTMDGAYILNPTPAELEESGLDLVVAGTEKAVLMVESEAYELSEEAMLGAVVYGHEQMQAVVSAVKEFAAEVGPEAWDWSAPVKDTSVKDAVAAEVADALGEAYTISDKMDRYARVGEIRAAVTETLASGDEPQFDAGDVADAFSSLEKDIVRGRVTDGQPRIDGRAHDTVRPITVSTGDVTRAHGSAVFTRGETQAIVVATLGTGRDAQMIDGIRGDYKDPFMLQYNFPPYCVGETGMMGSPKRREIGHGRLARRGVQAVLPTNEEFPYVLRVVSEITESNGSSSMASVCGTSLALMDAGVPLKAPVAGIAMGLVKDGDKYAILSDILGDEDHLGDMDFKVAGTDQGITALQMDIKIEGITTQIMEEALAQAQGGRLHILGEMNKELAGTRTELSEYAPRINTFKIHPDKIRDVIGKGGATIRQITEETGVSIDIQDDGTISVASSSKPAMDEAIATIERITAEIEVGAVYKGKVVRIEPFGAFVNVLPGKDGLVHISQISEERVEKVEDYINMGDVVTVKVLEVDRQGRVRLSMKEVEQD